jgi:hypothetical protein
VPRRVRRRECGNRGRAIAGGPAGARIAAGACGGAFMATAAATAAGSVTPSLIAQTFKPRSHHTVLLQY